MLNYRIERLDIDSEWRDQIGRVVGEAFNLGSPPSRVVDQILLTTNSQVNHDSVYFGAIENNELVGFNAFIAHELELKGSPIVAFQSEWSSTNIAHRGKRVFQNIIREAHRELALEGASFVFGCPNHISEPLLVNKLGYRRESSIKRNIPGLGVEHFFGELAAQPTGIPQNDAQLIRIKRAVYGEKLFVEGEGEDVLWGVLKSRTTRLGQVPYFKVGGMRWSKAGGAKELVRRMRKRLPRVAYWQVISEERNSINPAIGRFVPASIAPLVWFALDGDSAKGPFDFFGGIRGFF